MVVISIVLISLDHIDRIRTISKNMIQFDENIFYIWITTFQCADHSFSILESDSFWFLFVTIIFLMIVYLCFDC